MIAIADQQAKLDVLNAQLHDIEEKRRAIQDRLEDCRNRLTAANVDLAETHKAIAAGLKVEPNDLLTETRAVFEAQKSLDLLEGQSGQELADLDRQSEQLRAELIRARRIIQETKFADAVRRYQDALKPAVPVAAEIRELASVLGVQVPPQHASSMLLSPGTHVIGGVVIEL